MNPVGSQTKQTHGRTQIVQLTCLSILNPTTGPLMGLLRDWWGILMRMFAPIVGHLFVQDF